ncbi:hypothetical protein ACFX13_015099 [Malus domestica]
MTSSEVSIRDNCGNQRGVSFSSGFNDHNDARNAGEGHNGHSTVSGPGRGNSGEYGFISAERLWSIQYSMCSGF